jgi:hypothetical protein
VDKNVSTRDEAEGPPATSPARPEVKSNLVIARLKLTTKSKKKKQRRKKDKSSQRKEKKATQTLAIVLGETLLTLSCPDSAKRRRPHRPSPLY